VLYDRTGKRRTKHRNVRTQATGNFYVLTMACHNNIFSILDGPLKETRAQTGTWRVEIGCRTDNMDKELLVLENDDHNGAAFIVEYFLGDPVADRTVEALEDLYALSDADQHPTAAPPPRAGLPLARHIIENTSG